MQLQGQSAEDAEIATYKYIIFESYGAVFWLVCRTRHFSCQKLQQSLARSSEIGRYVSVNLIFLALRKCVFFRHLCCAINSTGNIRNKKVQHIELRCALRRDCSNKACLQNSGQRCVTWYAFLTFSSSMWGMVASVYISRIFRHCRAIY